jgi:hypothetical protein
VSSARQKGTNARALTIAAATAAIGKRCNRIMRKLREGNESDAGGLCFFFLWNLFEMLPAVGRIGHRLEEMGKELLIFSLLDSTTYAKKPNLDSSMASESL